MFWFDNEWVAVGAGIGSEHEATVVTGLNQTLPNGKVLVDGKQFKKGNRMLINPRWIFHNSVGYIFPGGSAGKSVSVKMEWGHVTSPSPVRVHQQFSFSFPGDLWHPVLHR